MDITSLLNLSPAGKSASLSGTAAGEKTSRFSETLQTAVAGHSAASTARQSNAATAGEAPANYPVVNAALVSGSILQQLPQGPLNFAAGALLNPSGLAHAEWAAAEQVEGKQSETELTETWSAEGEGNVGLPAMPFATLTPVAAPAGEITTAQSTVPVQTTLAAAMPTAMQQTVTQQAGAAAPQLETGDQSVNQPLSLQGMSSADRATLAPGAMDTGPLNMEVAQTNSAEALHLMPGVPSAVTPTINSAPTAQSTLVATPTLAMQSALGSATWGDEFGQHLLNMVHRGEQQVDLYLHPRELGALSVSLSLDDQGARAQFFSAHGAVRSAVEQAMPQLREALAQQGISLGETSVGDQRQSAFQQQFASGDHRSGRDGSNRTIDHFDNTPFESAADTSRATPVSLREIDFYA